jgi:hypothetical protein
MVLFFNRFCQLSLVVLFLFGITDSIVAQKYIQIETFGKVKPIRYQVGQEIEYQTNKMPGVWIKRFILEIDVDENLMYVNDAIIHLNSITRIRRDNDSMIRSALFAFAYASAASTFLYSGWAWIFTGVPPNWISITIVAAPFTLGYLIHKWTRYKTYQIGSKRRLRAIDLDFYEVNP